MDGMCGYFFLNFKRELKLLFVKHIFLLIHENNEVGTNFTFFEANLLKIEMFNRSFIKLS
jgi:hypothetical protein